MIVHPITNQEQLDQFIRGTHMPPYLQSWAWGEFQAQYGRRVWRLGVSEGDDLVGAATVVAHQLVLGRTYLYLPHGPVTESTEAARLLIDAIQHIGKKEGAMYIKIDPPFGAGHAAAVYEQLEPGSALQPRHTRIIHLEASADELLARMHPKTRYNIRLAEKRGVTIRWGSHQDDFTVFMRLQQATATRQKIRLHPEHYYRLMYQVLRDTGMVAFGMAEYQGEVIASNEIVSYGPVDIFAHGGSADKHKEVMAPYLLQWMTMLRAKERQATVYDLRGIAPSDREDHKLSGVTRFKMGFGGQTVVYPESRNIILDRPWWHMYRMAKRMRGGVDE